MNRRQQQLIAGLGMLALLGGYGVFAAATVQAHAQTAVTVELVGPRAAYTPTTHIAAEQQAADWGVTIVWLDDISCGQVTPGMIAVGCYKGGDEIFVLTGMTAVETEWVIFHELGHYLSKRDGLGWGEAEADAYAATQVAQER